MIPGRSGHPSSDGEKQIQEQLGTLDQAAAFYDGSMLDHLNERMQSYLRERRTIFIGCTNTSHAPQTRVRSGNEIIDVLNPKQVAWEEPADSDFWEQAATASHATLLAIDWEDSTVGFHLNGRIATERTNGHRRCRIDAKEAYIHCAKHIPRLERDPHTMFDDTRPISPDADLETLYNQFIAHRICFMLGTADADGETDISPRFGPQRFVQLTDRGLAYPEYRGNGVHASLGNMLETEQACYTFLDMWQSGTALHVKGDVTLQNEAPTSAKNVAGTDKTKIWVEMVPDSITITDIDGPAYSLAHHDPPWGTDDEELKRTGFFTVTDGN